MKQFPVVAIINSDDSVAETLSLLLREEGYRTVVASLPRLIFRPDDAARFLVENDPDVVVYDLSPFDESARFLGFLRGSRFAVGRSFVLTTTAEHEDVAMLEEAIDLRNCPHAGEALVEAVGRGVASARPAYVDPTRGPKAA